MPLGSLSSRLFAQTAVVIEPPKDASWTDELKRLLMTYAVPVGGKIVGAIVLLIVGRIVINSVRKMTGRMFARRKLDPTLIRYLDSVIGVVLTLMLLLATLSLFGIETTSFAGVLAAAGVAIGMAWSGLLSNFAAGVFMVVLRPFRVGDAVNAGGVAGDVREIGLFATVIDTPDNIRTIIGNSKIFSGTIQNFSANPHRRVELKAQLAASVNPAEAAAKLLERIAQIPNVLKDPAPTVGIAEFSAMGPVLLVSASTHNSHFGDVSGAMLVAIHEEFSKAGYPQPEQASKVRQAA